MLVLAGASRHGYGIMKEAERESGGGVRLELGSLYRMDSEITRSFDTGFGTRLVADNSVLPSHARRSGRFLPGEPGSAHR
jgi:hypothetical protein